MIRAWDPDEYDASHSYVWRFGEDLLALLSPQPGERVLDLGSGTGHLAAQIAAGGATVIGIDRSAEMVAQARAAYPSIDFREGDAAAFSVETPFDAVFSNATLHWVGRPAEVAASVARALVPGGRFVAEFGGKGNVNTVVEAVQAARSAMGLPERRQDWYFPSVGEYTPILEAAGLEVEFAALFDRPTPQAGGEAGLEGWLAMFGAATMDDIDVPERSRLIAAVANKLRPLLFHDGGWVIDYRRLRVVARKGSAAPSPSGRGSG